MSKSRQGTASHRQNVHGMNDVVNMSVALSIAIPGTANVQIAMILLTGYSQPQGLAVAQGQNFMTQQQSDRREIRGQSGILRGRVTLE